MSKDRRSFIKKSAALTAFAMSGLPAAKAGQTASASPVAEYAKDGGMEFSLAYFWGPEERKMALARQMDVLGAIGGINMRMAGVEGKPWDLKVIQAVQEAWAAHGLKFNVVEGPPALGTKTKLGLDGRDKEIEDFIALMKNLARAGIEVICYNWMPVISWARTTLDRKGRGGALVSAFDTEDSRREEDITEYGELTHQLMWGNMEYFLNAVIPEAEQVGMKLALHPDDPPVDGIRGIPRIMTSVAAFKKLVDLYPSPSNGLCFCQGSFASMGGQGEGEDIPAAIEYFGKRGLIHFVHFRDVKGNKHNFEEAFHDDGKTDMYRSMQAYYDVGFKGPIRPDHVPTMYGDSNEHPGYSTIGTLFAIGYMRGLIEAVAKQSV